MGTTISRLRAVVDADSVDAAGKKIRDFGRTVNETAQGSSRGLSGLGQSISGMGALTAAGIGAAAVGTAKLLVNLDNTRQVAENTRKQLVAYSGGVSQAVDATDALVRATDGGISRLEAAANASQLLGMGLAQTSSQVYDLSRMAVMLGDKTLGAEERMASFNAMLANQSVERLDTFGISSGRVRQRITELMTANVNLSREQAFVNSVLEIGSDKLRQVEAQGVTASTSVDKLTASWNDLKQAIAGNVSVGAGVEVGAGLLGDLTMLFNLGAKDPTVKLAALNRQLVDLKKQQADISAGNWQPEGFDTAQDAAARLAAKVTEVEAQIRYLRTSQAQYGDAGVTAFTRAATAADATAAAVSRLDRQLMNTQGAQAGWIAYRQTQAQRAEQAALEGSRGAQLTRWALPRQDNGAGNLVQDWIQRMNAATVTVGGNAGRVLGDSVADAWERAMNEAVNRVSSKLQEGMKFSSGLSDLSGGNPLAPGAGGPFEDVYRLQAWVKDGSWGDVAAKYGISDKGQAQNLIGQFQKGNFSDEVLKLVDVSGLRNLVAQDANAQASQAKLAQLIGADSSTMSALLGKDLAGKGTVLDPTQGAQLAKALKDGTTAELAKLSGESPSVLQSLLGVGEGTSVDFNGKLADSILAAVDADMTLKRADLEKRGANAWDAMETGMMDRASKSTKFAGMVEKMVDNSLDNYVPTN